MCAARAALVTAFSAPRYVIALSPGSAARAGAARDRGAPVAAPSGKAFSSAFAPPFSELLLSSCPFRCSESAARVPLLPLFFGPRNSILTPAR